MPRASGVGKCACTAPQPPEHDFLAVAMAPKFNLFHGQDLLISKTRQ